MAALVETYLYGSLTEKFMAEIRLLDTSQILWTQGSMMMTVAVLYRGVSASDWPT